MAGVQSGLEAGGDRPAGLVGNECDVLAWFDRKAGLHGVFCAGHQVRLWQAKGRHGEYFNAFAADLYWAVNTGTNGDTTDGEKPYHRMFGASQNGSQLAVW